MRTMLAVCNFTSLHHNRYKSTDEKPTNLSRLNPTKREYFAVNQNPKKARKNLVNHANNVTKITELQT